MEKLNIFSFKEEVFVDCNGNGPYDNLFPKLKRFTDSKELPDKYIINLNTWELKNDNFLDILSKNKRLVDDLRNKKAKILINRIGEFDSFSNGKIIGEEYERLFTFLEKLNVPKTNILYCNFNYLVEEAFYNTEIKVKYHNFTKFNLYNLNKDKKDSMLEYFNLQKKKLRGNYYLSYNHHPKPHRKHIVEFLQTYDVKSLLSASWKNLVLDGINDIENWTENNKTLYYYHNRDHFFDSYFSIITESHFADSTGSLNMGFTEKTWKPIINFHPFYMVGAKNSLVNLRKSGFETFTELIDERYDNLESGCSVSDSPRLDYICDDLKKVFSKSIYELNDIYYSMEEKVVHNFQHFFRLCETEINEFEDYLINFCNS